MKKLMISAVLLSMLPCSYAYSMDPWADPYGVMDDEAASVDNLSAVINNAPVIRETDITMPWEQLRVLIDSNDALRSYIVNGGNPNVASFNTKHSLLGFIAGKENNADMLQLLLQAGVDVNQKDKTGNTSLYDAIFSGSPEIVRMLIDAGAMINMENNVGVTPVQYLATLMKRSPHSLRLLAIKDYFITLNPENARILRDDSSVREPRMRDYEQLDRIQNQSNRGRSNRINLAPDRASRIRQFQNEIVELESEMYEPQPINANRAQQYPLAHASLVGVEDIPLAQAYYSSDEDNA